MSEELKVEDLLDQGRSTYYECELPTGLLVDQELHKTVRIREMTGVEEDLLGTMNSKNATRVLQQIVEKCIISIGDVEPTDPNWKIHLRSLVNSDRMFLLIHIRIASLGSAFSYKVGCPSCKKVSNHTVDLHDFKIEGLKDPYTRTWGGTLPSGKKYECKVTTQDKDIPGLDPEQDALSYAILLRLVELEDKSPTVSGVKNLSMRDRSLLRSEIREREGVIDNEVEMECPSCGHEFKSQISMAEPSFFFP